MRQAPLERDINIALNSPFWVEVANPEHPFIAMLMSHLPHYEGGAEEHTPLLIYHKQMNKGVALQAQNLT